MGMVIPSGYWGVGLNASAREMIREPKDRSERLLVRAFEDALPRLGEARQRLVEELKTALWYFAPPAGLEPATL